MPPKTTVEKKVQKVIEDKTFGLKNKNKSKKVQQYVQQVAQTAKSRGKSHREMELEQQAKEARKLAKVAKQQHEDEIGSLFKAVAVIKQQEVADNVDPKSVICAFFKAGSCKRGNKCKYSHDLATERKTQKINLYTDPRDADMNSGNWDQNKLESVVAQKYVKKPTETEIVCKYFLEAVEKRQYGWLWECPNGERCHYRHALPPGYVLKAQIEEEKEQEEAPDIGEIIEEERQKLDYRKCTPVTLETFKAWKEKKKNQREDEIEEKRKEAAKKSGGKGLNVLSGRALFMYDPSLFVDDDEAAAGEAYEIKEIAWAEEAKKDNALYNVDEQGGGDDDNDKSDDEQHDQADADADHDDASARTDAGAGSGAGTDATVGDASLFLDDDAELPED